MKIAPPLTLQLTDDELRTVKALIEDWGWEYGLQAERRKVAALARKLGLDRLAKDLEV